MTVIDSFSGEFHFLSNFHTGLDGLSAEHSYQAFKAETFHDFNLVMSAKTPGIAKRLGRKIKVKSNWDDIKIQVMTDVIDAKFADSELAIKLLLTGHAELIEGNTWHDNFWGNCSCPKCKNIIGQNHLGKILMKKREAIRIVCEGLV